MNSAFVDSSYLLALELTDDIKHIAAQQHWRQISSALPKLVTTSYILDEVVTFFNSRSLHQKAVQIGNSLLHSPSVDLIHVDEALFYEGWSYFQRHQDKQYSLTDCISFVVMKQQAIDCAFTFDRHFVQAGFQTQP